ncbi:hypothetical protein BPUTSESOX_365 [uncultured Gammaproteobacteria bacterium]|nr:hypothetical protein [uncultured Gammaproteobacteria bacterium]CAC9582610.1 hypothetical protein [uncultured Gammaproteobacteria bacterium]SSC10213.1 hypothetical protein BPUTEOSOX_1767 [thiotrophic endosymbiont of Bathymodiolus puteoserpentis (Logatchev)]VVH50968.1 hypothetical protein BPUTSESOX_365 [uncultured Gammaproteobacteria bacterium]
MAFFIFRGLCINRGDWQKPIFAHLVIFFKPYSSRAKAGFKESPSG